MDKINPRDIAIAAAGGTLIGAAGALITGDLDPENLESWKYMGIAAIGGAANSGVTNAASQYIWDPETARFITHVMWGVQTAAISLKTAGNRYGLNRDPVYNGIAFPIFFAANPASSSLSLLYAGTGSVVDGQDTPVHFYGGNMIVEHDMCMVPFILGAVSHCYNLNDEEGRTSQHESAHNSQYLAIGDIGFGVILVLDETLGTLFTLPWTPYYLMLGPGPSTIEPWAQKTEKKH